MIAYSVTHLSGADPVKVKKTEKGTTVLMLGRNAETTLYLDAEALVRFRAALDAAEVPA